MFGIPPSKRGQVVGWIRDKDNTVGDNRIRFITKACMEKERRNLESLREFFLSGFPNVDGPVLDKAEELGIIAK